MQLTQAQIDAATKYLTDNWKFIDDQVVSQPVDRPERRDDRYVGQRARPPTAQTAGPASGGAGSRRLRGAGNYLALIPFHAYIGAVPDPADADRRRRRVHDGDGPADARQRHAAVHGRDVFVDAFMQSIELAVATAIAGAIIGGLLAWAVVRGDPNGPLRQLVIAASGVLAQFGGVMLAFAFLATFGFNGLVTLFVPGRPARRHPHGRILAVQPHRAWSSSTRTSRSR